MRVSGLITFALTLLGLGVGILALVLCHVKGIRALPYTHGLILLCIVFLLFLIAPVVM